MRNILRPVLTALVAAPLALPVPALAESSANAPAGDVAWDIVSGLTTDVGQRLAGSEAEARARAWGAEKLKALGFQNVAVEPFTIRGYVRGVDKARLIAPVPQVLAVTALGYSGATPDKGIEGDIAYFPTLAALKAAPDGSLGGKIAFIDHAMRRAQDGAGYGPYGQVRREGPGVASRKGAAAVVIRSVGTDSHRNPHTGVTSFPQGVKPIPAGAVSNPDADLIARLAASGRTLRLALTLTGKTTEGMPSGNVVGELPGRDPSLPPILVGCHLDSWDLGTGAIDDASGCAIVTAAALKAQDGGRALRTIRVLWAGSEELGGYGGDAYAKAHAEPHALAMESDFGADRVWRVQTRFAPADKALAERIVAALNPLGVVPGKGEAGGGTDVEPVIEKQKLAVVDLGQDGTHYFDLHHTPDDTLDKVDPAALAQNVAAWTEVLKIVANVAEPVAPAG
ncbi:M28 family peptidase [Novosphingobium sp. KCTC 2891]|uniref:M28 family peptidase n=1 Tax=Novosphingobium sp. KCTC 2891 TaxID=2989730 RepID=UPI00222185FD|nr:M28 family peptidase [Novosphingobium sp. KCTC 2891]MCW1384401.1 M28 family peptidase [Novosphingobium sp. KCTC 2891]